MHHPRVDVTAPHRIVAQPPPNHPALRATQHGRPYEAAAEPGVKVEGSWVDATAVAARLVCRLVQHNMVVDDLNGGDLGGIDVEEEARIGGVAGDKRTLGPGRGEAEADGGCEAVIGPAIRVRFGAATFGGGRLEVCIISSLESSAPYEAGVLLTCVAWPEAALSSTPWCPRFRPKKPLELELGLFFNSGTDTN